MNRRRLLLIITPLAVLACVLLLLLAEQVGSHPVDAIFITLTLIAIVGGANASVLRLANFLTTLVHEMAHAAVGILNGGKVTGIVLNTDGSGYTVIRHKVTGSRLASNLATLAGYPGPLIFSTALLGLVALGYSWAAIIIAGVTGAMNLLFSRSFFTAGISLAFLAVFGGAALEHYYLGSSFALLFLGALLFARGIADLITLTRLTAKPERKADPNGVTDAEAVARGSIILRSVWFWTMMEWLLAFGGGAALVLIVVELAGIPVIAPVLSLVSFPAPTG